MGIYLGGGDVSVAKHGLNGPQVGTMGKQMGRERMAQPATANSLIIR